jgi:biopolymer transport protein ExbD
MGGIGGLIGGTGHDPPEEDEAPRLRLHIHVTTHENIVSDGIGGEYRVTDVAALHAHLLEIKENWPDDQTMTLTADDDVPFARVVQVLDHSRYGIEALGAPPSKRARPEDLFSYVALGAKSTD